VAGGEGKEIVFSTVRSMSYQHLYHPDELEIESAHANSL
jgi:hypothetical protein